MKNKNKLLPILGLALMLCFGAAGQSDSGSIQMAIVSAGNSVSNVHARFSFSIGQVNQEYISNDYQMNQGIQQPFEFVTVATHEPVQHAFGCIAYPNPVSTTLTVSIDENAFSPFKAYRIAICDGMGKTLYAQKIKDPISQVSVANLAPGAYFVQVLDDDDNYVVFQIIKI